MSKAKQNEYLLEAYKFLQDKHGRENILSAVVHRDETTPHLSAFIIPLTKENKLSCKSFYGERNALRDLQTDFHKEVGKKFGMERGIEKSGAKHVEIRSYYKQLGIERSISPAEPKFFESKEKYKDRLLEANTSHMHKARDLYNKNYRQEQQIKALDEENSRLRETVKDLGLDKLKTKDLERLKDYSKAIQKENVRDTQINKSREPKKSTGRKIPFKGSKG